MKYGKIYFWSSIYSYRTDLDEFLILNQNLIDYLQTLLVEYTEG